MDASTEQAWSGQPETLTQMENELRDLENLFEFGDIGLGPAVDSTQYGEHVPAHNTHPHTPFEEMSEAQAIARTSAQDLAGHDQFIMSQMVEQQRHPSFHAQAATSNPYVSDSMYQPSLQAQYASTQSFDLQATQAVFPTHQHIPPTPNSYEMHGEAGKFMQAQLDQQQRAILEQRFQLHKEDAIAFTPMASPAGTPQFNMLPEYTTPGAYFSPLTSPMIRAQTSQQQQQVQHQPGYYTNPSTAPTSNATSPLDPSNNVDMLGEDTSFQPRKSSRKKIPTPRSAGPLARVKQSPVQKAVKRKSSTMLSSMVPLKDPDYAHDVEQFKTTQPGSAGLQMPPQFRNDSSENGSISPEPLSEALMGPPPRPGSRPTQSPALKAQPNGSAASLGSAATPKSLLSMRKGDQSSPSGEQRPGRDADGQPALEELHLPDAATGDGATRPSLPHLDTQIRVGSSEDSGQNSSRKTPKLGPLSTPSSARPPSATQSPSVAGSPMTATTPGVLLKDKVADLKAVRAGKKRSSIGNCSTLVSPALRPRISPSIKPLLPEGAVHSPTHALLLASKSNYQNLLEGNHLPGVSYPDSLSTGLTSKRTSHKVAEQGRRNRINEALKEMQSLLPRSPSGKPASNANGSTINAAGGGTTANANTSDGSPDAGEPDDKDSKEDFSAKSNSSKAATVESANEYIRRLQQENAALLQIKKEHEEMKKKLGEHALAAVGAAPTSADDPAAPPADSPADPVATSTAATVKTEIVASGSSLADE